MKKIGFTLAEVVITLGIIGVVSALTAPSLVGSYQKSKVGPSLKKFINTIETANQQILMDKMSNTLSGALGDSYTWTYLEELQKHVKGRFVGEGITDIDSNAKTPTTYNGAGGIPTPTFVFQFNDGSSLSGTDSGAVPTPLVPSAAYRGPFTGNYFYYDTNGFQNEPNKLGRDIFVFIIDNSGSVIPYGAKIAKEVYKVPYWDENTDGCPTKSNTVTSGLTCAGSVIDNDGKVIYKY